MNLRPSQGRLEREEPQGSVRGCCGVFLDPLAKIDDDSEHEKGRFKMIGCPPGKGTVLVVVYAEISSDEIRIISAWRATAHERRLYAEG
jgi:uncharacterized DUF497 family protein